MKTKLKLLAMAVVVGAGVGAAGQAAASVYAGSQLHIRDLVVAFINPVTGVPLTNVQPSYFFGLTSQSILNTSFEADTKACFGTVGLFNTCSPVAPVLDPNVTNAPGGGVIRGANDYSLGGQTGDKSFSNANSVIQDAQTVNFLPTDMIMVAEAEMSGNGTGFASNVFNSNISFNLTQATLLSISFTADTHLITNLTLGSGESGQAQSASNVQLRINGAGGFFSWDPGLASSCDGVFVQCAGGPLGVTGVDRLAQLQSNLGGAGVVVQETIDVTSVTYTALLMLAPGFYSAATQTQTSVNVQKVPEPGTLLLLGSALLGFGALRRRPAQSA